MSCGGTPGPPGPAGPQGPAGPGAAINPTDLFIPYRVDATHFGDSPWFFSGGEVIGQFPADTTFVFGDGVFLYRKNNNTGVDLLSAMVLQNNTPADVVNQHQYAPGFSFQSNAWATTDAASTGVFMFLFLEPIPGALQTDCSSSLHIYSLLNLGGHSPLEQFRLLSDSGFTGVGNLFLSDDGTYKPVSGGSGLTVLDNGAYGVSGPASYSIDIPGGSTAVDDCWHCRFMGNINSSAADSLEISVGGGLVFASGFPVSTFIAELDIYRMSGSTNNMFVTGFLSYAGGVQTLNSQLVQTNDFSLNTQILVQSATSINVYSRSIYKIPHA